MNIVSIFLKLYQIKLQKKNSMFSGTMLLDGGCLNYRRPERSSRSMSLGNAAWTLSRPAVIYVQPRERHANKNHVLPAHNSVNISPDFSQFGGSSEKISYKER